MVEMDDDSRVTIDYLRGLPHGAVVPWTTHDFSSQRPWTTGWIDARIADAGAPPMNWHWTIIGHDDPDGTGPDQLWQFVWPYDLDVHRVWDDTIGSTHDLPAPTGEPCPRGDPCACRVIGGWSVEAAGKAIARWAASHANRPDLIVVWDPDGEPDPTITLVAERARQTASGAPVWDLGEGLTVTDGMMDDLLAMDPDERAHLMGILRETSDQFHAERGIDADRRDDSSS